MQGEKLNCAAPESQQSTTHGDDDGHERGGLTVSLDTSNQKAGWHPNLSLARAVLLVFILASSSFINTAIAQASVIVLPTIGRELSIPAGRLQWVLSAASLANACTLLLWGRVADICGRRLVFQCGLAVISLSCLISPFAPEEVSFDIFRMFQGLGSAAATPSAVGIIFGVFPPGKGQIYAMSVFSAGFPLGNVVGCVLGGIIAQYLNWKWIFWILSIISAASCAMSIFVIPPLAKDIELKSTPLADRLRLLASQMDWVGLLMSTTCLMFLLVSLTEGNVVGWAKAEVLVLLVLGCALLPIFIIWELRLEKQKQRPPLMKLSAFSSRYYSASQALSCVFWAAFSNFMVFATYFYQNYQELSVIQTTLRFLPSGITGVITVCIASQILNRVDGYTVALWGTSCVTVACLLFAVPIPTETSYWAYGFPAMIILTLGADTLSPCLALFVMQSVPPDDQAMGAAIFQTVAQVGRGIGLAIATAIQITVTDAALASLDEKASLLRGYRSAEWFNFALGIASVAVAAYSFRGAGKLGSK